MSKDYKSTKTDIIVDDKAHCAMLQNIAPFWNVCYHWVPVYNLVHPIFWRFLLTGLQPVTIF